MSRDSRRSFNPRKRDFAPGRTARRGPSASNAVVSAILQCAAIHGQPAYRMQSRSFEVPGEEGRLRPFFVGEWTDRYGAKIWGGMADVLCTPTVELIHPQSRGDIALGGLAVQLAVWCEAKSGKGKLTEKQELFRENVEETGGVYLLCQDSAEELLRWFGEHQLVRP